MMRLYYAGASLSCSKPAKIVVRGRWMLKMLFSFSDLDREILMEQPTGFSTTVYTNLIFFFFGRSKSWHYVNERWGMMFTHLGSNIYYYWRVAPSRLKICHQENNLKKVGTLMTMDSPEQTQDSRSLKKKMEEEKKENTNQKTKGIYTSFYIFFTIAGPVYPNRRKLFTLKSLSTTLQCRSCLTPHPSLAWAMHVLAGPKNWQPASHVGY